MSDYTPTVNEVRYWVAGRDLRAGAEFDRMIATVRADHEQAVRKRIAREILAEADRIDPSDDWPEDDRTRGGGAVSIHEQARAEAEKRYPSDADGRQWGTALGFIPAGKREAYVAGFLAGHEAATRTREGRLEAALAAVLTLHRRDDDGDCIACGVDTWEEPIPWPCETARAVDTAMRAGSVDTHTDTPGEDTDHAE